MRRVPWWAVLSAALAPVSLIGGWSLAAASQPAGYNPIRDTISALAGVAATDRWIMTVGLAGLGLCHLATAAGLRPAAGRGRLLLAVGGAATVTVATFPVPRVGTSGIHPVAAGIGFVALALWPAFAWRRGRPVPWGLRPLVAVVAVAVLVALLGWFAVELYGDGARVGATERLLAGAEGLWPLVVVLTARLADRPPRVIAGGTLPRLAGQAAEPAG
jgi:hypothetical membrane protein